MPWTRGPLALRLNEFKRRLKNVRRSYLDTFLERRNADGKHQGEHAP